MSENIKKTPPDPKKLAGIRFLIMDVDGVMTDGGIVYSDSGAEWKRFDVKDGAGIKYWQRAGHSCGIITGRSSDVVMRRAAELDIAHVEMGAKMKMPALEKMLSRAGVSLEETAMIGDDLPDLPLIRRVGFGVAVADAVEEVKMDAAYITRIPGGRGAVREVIELLLKSQGLWEGIMKRYLR